jgi:hypothetical protein
MNYLIDDAFAPIIQSCKLLLDETKPDSSRIKLKIELIDGSVLFVKEAKIIPINFVKYSYQWQNADGSLLVRWDNTPHHSHISTFPFHQHFGSESAILASEIMTLPKVLTYIANELRKTRQ